MKEEEKSWFSRQMAKWRQARRAREERRIKAEANHRLQVREFYDTLYIALDGQPILCMEDLCGTSAKEYGLCICDMLSIARDNLANYLSERVKSEE